MRRLLAAVLFFCFAVLPAHADLRASVNALGQVKLDGLEAAIKTLAADPAPAVPAILDALGEGNLYVRKSDAQVFIAVQGGSGFVLTDPVTGEAAGEAKKSDLTKIKINNALRRAIKAAAGGSELASPDATKRLSAAKPSSSRATRRPYRPSSNSLRRRPTRR